MDLIVILAITLFVWVGISIIRDLPAARYNLSCHGTYGKFYGKGRAECETCDERFECFTT